MSGVASRLRKAIAPLALASACLLLLAATGSSGGPVSAVHLPDGAIRPTARQQLLAPRIANILEQAHYSGRRIDKEFSSQVFDRYLDALDGQRSYFQASDIADMQQWRSSFDDMIHTGQLEPAFLIFARLQERNRERMQYALKLLATEPDWKLNESYVFDREKAAWPHDSAELDELWRQRVKNDALSLMLTGKSWPDTAETLRKRYERLLARVGQVSADDVFETLMNAYAAVYDPHSNYFSPRSSEEYRIQMSLSYEGIGASLQLVDDYVTISSLLPGGPAAAANTLKANDRILAVGQGSAGPLTDVVGWRLDDVVQLIRGKGDTQVRLQILPAGAAPGTDQKIVALTRGKVTLENQAAKKEVRQVHVGDRTLRVGVITVPGFYEDNDARSAGDPNYRTTARDVRAADRRAAVAGRAGCARARPARGRRRLPAGSHRAQRPVHRPRPDRAAADHRRQHRGAAGSRARHRLRWPIGRARGPHQRVGLGDLCRRDPGLSSRRGARSDHFRQGHGAEPDSARPLVEAVDRGSADRDHRQVLPRNRREHAVARRRARHQPAGSG